MHVLYVLMGVVVLMGCLSGTVVCEVGGDHHIITTTINWTTLLSGWKHALICIFFCCFSEIGLRFELHLDGNLATEAFSEFGVSHTNLVTSGRENLMWL